MQASATRAAIRKTSESVSRAFSVGAGLAGAQHNTWAAKKSSRVQTKGLDWAACLLFSIQRLRSFEAAALCAAASQP
eukprot:6198241-Pleurochrysis_carterae.AAC.1